MIVNYSHSSSTLIFGIVSFLSAIAIIALALAFKVFRLKSNRPQPLVRYGIELGVLSAGEFVWAYVSLLYVVALALDAISLADTEVWILPPILNFLESILGLGIALYLLSIFFSFPLILMIYAAVNVILVRILRSQDQASTFRDRSRLIVWTIAGGSIAGAFLWILAIRHNSECLLADVSIGERVLAWMGVSIIAIAIPWIAHFLQTISMAMKMDEYFITGNPL